MHLQASDGIPPKAPVPGVIGKPQGEASTIIQTAGFGVSVNEVETNVYSENGKVLDQSPHPGAKALLGSTVTIDVGKFVKASPTPPPPPPTTPPPTGPPPTTPPPDKTPTPKPSKSKKPHDLVWPAHLGFGDTGARSTAV